jgi:nicotinamidase/pyrazinamidase
VYDVIELHGLPQVLWPAHCVTGSDGWRFHPQLELAHVTHNIPKGTDREIDSYSGFFDNGQRKATGLEAYLRAQSVTDVYVLGLATDYCVKATALDAQRLGFNTYVIEDGCRAVNLQPSHEADTKAELRAAGVRLIGSHELQG